MNYETMSVPELLEALDASTRLAQKMLEQVALVAALLQRKEGPADD